MKAAVNIPDFAASESDAINLVAALEYFAKAKDIIVAARQAQLMLRDAEKATAASQTRAAELTAEVAALELELSERTQRVEEQRKALAADAATQRAEHTAALEAFTEMHATRRRTLDQEFEAYRQGEAATRRAALNEELDGLTRTRDRLRTEVSELELRRDEVRAQMTRVASLVAQG